MAKSLAQFVESVSGTSHLRVEQDLGDGFVRLQTSEAERRQAIQDIKCSEDIVLELLRNSRDAHARNIYIALSREGDARTIVVIDDGDGIPPSKHKAVFEPRVTSKLDTSHMDAWGLHGRGMALYSISVNSDVACVKCSALNFGCALYVRTNLGKLGEKRDQSTYPSFIVDQDNNVSVRGPKNIVRTAMEFALEARSECSVYLGSPTEVAATIYDHAMAALSAIDRTFTSDPRELPITKRLAIASDPDDFAAIADELGLSMSSRSARRIMDHDIQPAPSLLDCITLTSADSEAESRNDGRTARAKEAGTSRANNSARVSISQTDRDEFERAVLACYRDLAQKYYLESDVAARTRVANGAITVTIPLAKQE